MVMAVTRGEECGHGGRETVKMKRVNLMLDDETLKILDRMALPDGRRRKNEPILAGARARQQLFDKRLPKPARGNT